MACRVTARRVIAGTVPVEIRRPDAWNKRTAIVLAHGAGQGMDSEFMTFFHEGLAHLGHLTAKFNFPYMETGRRVPDSQTRMRAVFTDVALAIAEEFSPKTLFIGGKSMGGRVGSHIAADLPAVAGLVFLGYPLHPQGRPDRLRDEHLYDIGKPMLFISGTRDPLATRELLQGVVARIGPNARLHWAEGGDHSLKAGRRGPDLLPDALEQIDRWIRTESGKS